MNEFFIHSYVVIAGLAALLLVFVIWQAINNLHLKRNDPPQVARARKITFYLSAGFLLLTVIFKDYWLTDPTVIPVAIVSSGFLIMCISVLSVSMVSMWLQKPRSGHWFLDWMGQWTVFGRLARIAHRSHWARDK